MKNIIVQLRIYRGKVTYNESGKITSDVQTMKIEFGRLEWVNFMKAARLVYTKIDVVGCTDKNNDYKVIDTPSEVLSDVEKALKGEDVALTPQQQEIKELKDAVAELKGKKKKEEPKKEDNKEESKPKEESNTEDSKDELETLREQYTKLYGKKPSHLMREKGLKAKIADKS